MLGELRRGTQMTPQITIYLDTSGALHAEMPGENGARKKFDLNTFDISPYLFDKLEEQQQRETARKQREALRAKKLESERHTRVLEYTAAHYPSALKFIDPKFTKELANANWGAAMRRAKAAQTAPRPKSKSARNEKRTKLDEAISQIQL